MKKKFYLKDILQIFFDNNIFKNTPVCEKCNKQMKLIANKLRVNGKMMRCTQKGLNKHDIKLNILNCNISGNFKADIRIIHFLLLNNFLENKNIKNSYINVKKFSKL